ncbi:MAG: hypothetical protein ACI8TX_001593 [Hyphomicrobiaceae bacterium]|jgi:hypothetical protein
MNNAQQAPADLSQLCEQKLLDHFERVIAQGRRNTVQLLIAMNEIDARKLWAKHACSSMFTFCMERYHMSEGMTAKRLWAARIARRFPVVLGMLERGELHLTAVHLLANHLTDANHSAVLVRAKHKSARQIERLIADIAPRPDVPSRVRALPATNDRVAPPTAVQLIEARLQSQGSGSQSAALPGAPMPATAARGRITPLAPRRYKVEITIDQKTHDRLRALEDLLSHQEARDPAAIVSHAIELLLAETLKKKAALTDRPQKPGSGVGTSPRTRAIPAALRRAVWLRDDGRCGFEDAQGHRCRATRNLEFHHKIPFGRGGQHEIENIELRCHGHNQYQADLDFGRAFMGRKRGESFQQSAPTVGVSSREKNVSYRNENGPVPAEARTGPFLFRTSVVRLHHTVGDHRLGYLIEASNVGSSEIVNVTTGFGAVHHTLLVNVPDDVA